jgi:hypothetical protein
VSSTGPKMDDKVESSEKYAEEIIERTEKFIKQVRDMDIVVDPIAMEIILTHIDAFGQQSPRSLSDALGMLIHNYEFFKDMNPEMRYHFASLAIEWIDKAYYYGVINPGEGLRRKLEECSTEKYQLQKDMDRIAERNLQLEFENTDLRSRLNQIEKLQKVFKETNK